MAVTSLLTFSHYLIANSDICWLCTLSKYQPLSALAVPSIQQENSRSCAEIVLRPKFINIRLYKSTQQAISSRWMLARITLASTSPPPSQCFETCNMCPAADHMIRVMLVVAVGARRVMSYESCVMRKSELYFAIFTNPSY